MVYSKTFVLIIEQKQEGFNYCGFGAVIGQVLALFIHFDKVILVMAQ